MAPVSFVYVSNADDRTITVLALDNRSGQLTRVQSVEVPGADADETVSMPLAVGPDRRMLYAAVRVPPFPASSFSIGPGTGRLSLRGTVVLPDAMAYIATDRSGRFLFGAAYRGSKLTVNALDGDGTIVQPALQVIAETPHAHCILADPSNRLVYAAVLGASTLARYLFDSEHGTLMPAMPNRVRMRVGATPRHFVFHPNGLWLYVLNEADAEIDHLEFDARGETLETRQTIRMFPDNVSGELSAADLHLTPDGRFLYGSERISGTLAGFSVDSASGRLVRACTVATEPSPRGFNIAPDGRHLVCAGQTSSRISLYAIDQVSGRLDFVTQEAVGCNPNWIEIVDPS